MKFTKQILAIVFLFTMAFTGCKPKDSDIQTNVQEKINGMPDASGINVAVNDGVATLTGQVNDEATKAEAAKAAEEVNGVKSVVNNLTVPPPPPPVSISDDAALTQGVTDATKDFPTVAAVVTDGEITLTGSIERSNLPTLMQSLNALNPKKVNNNLTIK